MKQIILKSMLAISLGVLASLLAATTFALAGKQDFVLHNQTGVEIHELYVSPHSSDDWEDNVLGRDSLPDGESVKIAFNDREKHDLWDLRVVDSNGASIAWDKLDLTKISEVTLHYKNGKAWADVR